jgi:hypothetical protein
MVFILITSDLEHLPLAATSRFWVLPLFFMFNGSFKNLLLSKFVVSNVCLLQQQQHQDPFLFLM